MDNVLHLFDHRARVKSQPTESQPRLLVRSPVGTMEDHLVAQAKLDALGVRYERVEWDPKSNAWAFDNVFEGTIPEILPPDVSIVQVPRRSQESKISDWNKQRDALKKARKLRKSL